jgi:hypothetical protein
MLSTIVRYLKTACQSTPANPIRRKPRQQNVRQNYTLKPPHRVEEIETASALFDSA